MRQRVIRSPPGRIPPSSCAEADEATALLNELVDYVQRLSRIYPFKKGMGLAVPQIGVSRTLAVVRPPDSDASWLF